MRMIKLTDRYKKPVWVNPEFIGKMEWIYYGDDDVNNHTFMVLAQGHTTEVLESPEEILAKIKAKEEEEEEC